MAGNTPAEAVHNFLGPLQQAIRCVTDAVLLVSGGYHPASQPHPLTLSNQPAPLGRDRRIALKLIQHYQIVQTDDKQRGPWKVQTGAYYYTFVEPISPHQEILAYHWHPASRSTITYPHLHISSGAGVQRQDVLRAHFPTGRIAVEQVLRLAITEFGVVPLRDDWETIIVYRADPAGF